MTVDEVLVVGSDPLDEERQFTVKSVVEAPPIPLWKIGLILLALIGGGTGVYYLTKGGGE